MGTLTVTAKGQVTLKKDILEHLGVGPGGRISVEKLPGGRITVSAAPTGDISAVFGMLKTKGGPALTIEEMNEIVRQGWAGEAQKRTPSRPKK
ncbi:MAG: type II toxin-antitoxin system PrlF family antitoxin [Hyphomonadaceae bacterium]|nr:type II toxin-antitoxin system PrlF family antitoxin [Hyphomonadaceae bacterium]